MPNKAVRRATAYVCGLGFFDLYLNGQLIGDQLMNPALTGYDRRDLYATFDVTADIQNGGNAIGVVLCNGRFFAPRAQIPVPMNTYGFPKLLALLHLELADGTEQTIVSDDSWKLTADGPIRASNEFDGEEYDARREMPGWAAPGFDASAWQAAELVDPPGGQLEAQMIEPIRVIKEFKPVQLVEPKPGIWMVDFGQAFYGVVRLRAQGPAATRIRLRASFNVLPDGTLNYHNDRSAQNTDIYELKGQGLETWHPRFRGNATRWAQVDGYPGTPSADSFTGLVTHTDHEPAGTFECSSELVNRIYSNACWGTRLQNRSVPMEPDRDERMPWSGHPAKTSESEGWVFNVARFYAHFLKNYRVHQGDDGSLQEILPPYWTFNNKDIVWPSVVTIIPDWYYNFYGDDRPLRDNFETMKRFVRYHEQTNLKPDGTMDFCIFGDWVDTSAIGRGKPVQGATSRALMGTAYFYRNCRIVERAARLLGKPEDEKYFGALADRVLTAFNHRFFDPASGTYESKTQCAYVLPLAFGLVPGEHRQAVADNLANDVLVAHQGHTSVGLIGMQWQMQVLTDVGRAEVGYKNRHPPRAAKLGLYGFERSHHQLGTLGLRHPGRRHERRKPKNPVRKSRSLVLPDVGRHQLRSGASWIPAYLCFAPTRSAICGRARPPTFHTSLYGKIESDWRLEGDRFVWRIVVPPNTTATVVVPTSQAASVRESGAAVASAAGVKAIGQTANSATFEVGSGEYRFEAAK